MLSVSANEVVESESYFTRLSVKEISVTAPLSICNTTFSSFYSHLIIFYDLCGWIFIVQLCEKCILYLKRLWKIIVE